MIQAVGATMKVSQAMLIGDGQVVQSYGTMFKWRRIAGRYALVGACALGCTYIGRFGKPTEPSTARLSDYVRLETVYPELVKGQLACPSCQKKGTLLETIAHLNDTHAWSTARIAEHLRAKGL